MAVSASVFTGSQHTNRYLHFESHHPRQLKQGLVRCLFDRAEKVTLDDKKLSEERKQLHKVLNANGYPKRFISRATASGKSSNGKGQDWKPKITITIPYVVGVSEEIRRICNISNIRVAFRTVRTIRSKLARVKDPLPLEKQSMVVYCVPSNTLVCIVVPSGVMTHTWQVMRST